MHIKIICVYLSPLLTGGSAVDAEQQAANSVLRSTTFTLQFYTTGLHLEVWSKTKKIRKPGTHGDGGSVRLWQPGHRC